MIKSIILSCTFILVATSLRAMEAQEDDTFRMTDSSQIPEALGCKLFLQETLNHDGRRENYHRFRKNLSAKLD